jgi:hypothetical protein
MAARIGTDLTGRDARSLGSADIVSGMLFETQRPCLNQPKLVRITLASKNDRMRVDNGQTESQLSLPGHCGQNSRVKVHDCYLESKVAVRSIPATSGGTAMSSSTYKHEADWCYRRSGGWRILSLDLIPESAMPLSLCSLERQGGSVIRNGTDRTRKTGPPKGRWLASLLYRLPPFHKERGKVGHPSFICDSGMQPCARESPTRLD